MLYSIRADFTDISALPTGILVLELIVLRSVKFELSYTTKTWYAWRFIYTYSMCKQNDLNTNSGCM